MRTPLGFTLDQLITSKEFREIDRNYQVTLAAKNTDEIVELQKSILKRQLDLISGSAVANQRLQSIDFTLQDIALVLRGLDASLTSIAESLVEQNAVLSKISSTLARPYQTQARELRAAAETSLINGMTTRAPERDAHFDDAFRLLSLTQENPIGLQDAVVWFQMGWLLWKQKRDLSGAERAFWHASRLCAPHRGLYYANSVRHRAYMLYLQGDAEAPYDLMSQLLDHTRHPDTLFDMARYADKTGHSEEAAKFLEEAIQQRPSVYLNMFIEPDLTPQLVQRVSATLTQSAQCQLKEQIEVSATARICIMQALTTAGSKINLSLIASNIPQNIPDGAGYLELLALTHQCIEGEATLYGRAVKELEQISETLRSRGRELTHALERTQWYPNTRPALRADFGRYVLGALLLPPISWFAFQDLLSLGIICLAAGLYCGFVIYQTVTSLRKAQSIFDDQQTRTKTELELVNGELRKINRAQRLLTGVSSTRR